MNHAAETEARCMAVERTLEALNRMPLDRLVALSKGLRILRDRPLKYHRGICYNIFWAMECNNLGSSPAPDITGCLIVLVMPETYNQSTPLNGNCYPGQPYYSGLRNKWEGEQGELRRSAIDRLIHRIENIEIPALTMVECDWEDWRDEQ